MHWNILPEQYLCRKWILYLLKFAWLSSRAHYKRRHPKDAGDPTGAGVPGSAQVCTHLSITTCQLPKCRRRRARNGVCCSQGYRVRLSKFIHQLWLEADSVLQAVSDTQVVMTRKTWGQAFSGDNWLESKSSRTFPFRSVYVGTLWLPESFTRRIRPSFLHTIKKGKTEETLRGSCVLWQMGAEDEKKKGFESAAEKEQIMGGRGTEQSWDSFKE